VILSLEVSLIGLFCVSKQEFSLLTLPMAINAIFNLANNATITADRHVICNIHLRIKYLDMDRIRHASNNNNDRLTAFDPGQPG